MNDRKKNLHKLTFSKLQQKEKRAQILLINAKMNVSFITIVSHVNAMNGARKKMHFVKKIPVSVRTKPVFLDIHSSVVKTTNTVKITNVLNRDKNYF